MPVKSMNCCEKGIQFFSWAREKLLEKKEAILSGALTALGLYAASVPLASLGVSGMFVYGLSGRTCVLPEAPREKVQAVSSGVSPEEGEQIRTYVQEHLSSWQSKLPKEGLRIRKEVSGLPRTLRVFRENDQLYVLVLCNSKGGAPTWEGTSAKVKMAIDVLTGHAWARRSIPLNGLEEGNLLYTNWMQMGELPGIIAPLIGHSFMEKGGEKGLCYEFFMPLREGSMESLKQKTLSQEEILSIYSQLLSTLVYLESKNIVHGDFSDKNVLYFFDEQGNLKLELIDFDEILNSPGLAQSRQTKFDKGGDLAMVVSYIFRPLLNQNKDHLPAFLVSQLEEFNRKMASEARSAKSFYEEFLSFSFDWGNVKI